MIERAEVLHIAKLAKLKLSEAEIELFQGQLNACLEAFQKISQLDTSEIQPMQHILDLHNVTRPDEPRPSLPVEQALRNAPCRRDGFFEVPAVFEARSE